MLCCCCLRVFSPYCLRSLSDVVGVSSGKTITTTRARTPVLPLCAAVVICCCDLFCWKSEAEHKEQQRLAFVQS